MLTAIAIPVFTSQLERSREATDAANLRAAYAEVMTSAITGTSDTSAIVNLDTNGQVATVTASVGCKQQVPDWQNTAIEEIGGVAIADIPATDLSGWTITYTASTNAVTFAENYTH